MNFDVAIIGGGLVGASLAAAPGQRLCQLLRGCERREDICLMQATTYGLKHLFNNNNPLLRNLRNLGLNATNHLAPIKKLLIRHALN